MTDNRNFEQKLLETFAGRRMFLIPGSTSGRLGIDGLSAIAMMSNADEVYNGSVFVFCTTASKQIKFLMWSDGGYWMVTRKIYKGTFAWPCSDRSQSTIETAKHMIQAVLNSAGAKRGAVVAEASKTLFSVI